MEHGYEGETTSLLTAAIAGLSPRAALQQSAGLLAQYGLALRRAQVDE